MKIKTANSTQGTSPFRGLMQASLPPMLVKAAGTVATFALSIVLARSLGISEFGIYSLVVSMIMVLSIPIRSGIQTLAIRETSRALADEAPAAIGFLLRWSNRIIYSYTVAVFGIVILVWIIIDQNDFLDGLLITIVSVGTLSLTLRNSAILRGSKRFAKGSSPDILIRPLAQLAVLVAILFVSTWSNATAFVGLTAFTAASITAWLVSVFWLRRELSSNGDIWADTGSAPPPWHKPLLFLTIAGGGQVLFGHIDTLILGALGDPEQVGAFRISMQISMLLIFILTVVNQVLQPNLVRLYHLKDISGMQKLVSDSSFFMFLATLLLGVGLIFFATPLIGLTFGNNYAIASTALQILVIGQVMNVFFGSVGTILIMTGMEKEAVTSMSIAIIVNIILDIVLIPLFGMVGAASASALSIFVWNMISRHYVNIRVGIESSGVIHKTRHIVTQY